MGVERSVYYKVYDLILLRKDLNLIGRRGGEGLDLIKSRDLDLRPWYFGLGLKTSELELELRMRRLVLGDLGTGGLESL